MRHLYMYVCVWHRYLVLEWDRLHPDAAMSVDWLDEVMPMLMCEVK